MTPGQQFPCDGPPASVDPLTTVECSYNGPTTGGTALGGTLPARGTVQVASTSIVRLGRGEPVLLAQANQQILLGRTTSRSDGSFSLLVSLPRNASGGLARIEARGTLRGAPVTYTRTVIVAGAPAAGGGAPSRLPVTGADMVLLVIWALFLVGFGATLIVASWRRYKASKEAREGGPVERSRAPVATGRRRTRGGMTPVHDDTGELQMISDEDADVVTADRTRFLVGAGGPGSFEDAANDADEYLATEWDAARLSQGNGNGAMRDAHHDDYDDTPAPPTTREELAPIGGGSQSDVEFATERAAQRTSEVVSRLRDEIAAWSKPKDQ